MIPIEKPFFDCFCVFLLNYCLFMLFLAEFACCFCYSVCIRVLFLLFRLFQPWYQTESGMCKLFLQ